MSVLWLKRGWMRRGVQAPALTALEQILALEPTALWWPSEGSGWQGRTGGTLSAIGSPVGILPDLSELGGATLDEWLANPTSAELIVAEPTLGAAWSGSGGEYAATAAGLGNNLVWSGLDITEGAVYAIEITATISAGTAAIRLYQNGEYVFVGLSNGTTTHVLLSGAQGVGTAYINSFVIAPTATFTGTVSSISVREIPGIHAIAPGDSNRPLLGRVPVTGRRNLLTRTEEFENAVWTLGSVAIGSPTKGATNTTVSPDGTTTADEISFPPVVNASDVSVIRQLVTTSATNYAGSVYLKAKAAGDVGKKIGIWINDGDSINFSWLTISADWQRLTITDSVLAGISFLTIGVGGASFGGQSQDACSIYIWGAQFETGSTASDYQKVVTALDVTEAGVADTYYASFDGVDDHFALSSSIPITEEMTVVRAFGRSAAGINSVGLGNSASSAPHDHYWISNDTAFIGRLSDDTVNFITLAANTSTGNFVATARRNASIETLRRNGTQIGTITANAVGGNFDVFGRRNTVYNNGPISFLAVFDRELTGAELELVESIAAGTNGATLP